MRIRIACFETFHRPITRREAGISCKAMKVLIKFEASLLICIIDIYTTTQKYMQDTRFYL